MENLKQLNKITAIINSPINQLLNEKTCKGEKVEPEFFNLNNNCWVKHRRYCSVYFDYKDTHIQ